MLFMKTLKSVLFLLGILLSAFSQKGLSNPITDPLRDYLETADVDRDSAVPHPKMLLKLEIDLEGHGKKAVLLSMQGYFDRAAGNIWAVYIPMEGGYKRIDTDGDGLIAFHPSSMYVGWVSEIEHWGLVDYVRGSTWNGGVAVLWLDHGKLLHKGLAIMKWTEDESGSNKTYDKYFGKAKDGVKKASEYPVEELSSVELRKQGYTVREINRP